MKYQIKNHGPMKSRVTVTSDDGLDLLASEVGDLADGRHRERIVKAIAAAAPSIEEHALEEAMLKHSFGQEPVPEAPAEDSTPAEREEARQILASGSLLDQIEDDLGTVGIVGESKLKLAVYIVATSRLLVEPLHAIVNGDSASGKSYVIKRVASMIPEESKKVISHLTPQALYYLGDVRHLFLVLGERSRSDGPEVEDATKAMREFRSDGRLSKQTVNEGAGEALSMEGPAATIESTTKEGLFNEDANRCLLLFADESAEQTKMVLAHQSREHEVRREQREAVLRRHHAMQRILGETGTPAEVVIPFGPAIAARFPLQSPEVRRAHELLRGVIKASAVLHRLQRATDENGRIVATLTDYSIAVRLVGNVITSACARKPNERLVRFFESLSEHVPMNGEFTAPDLGVKLQLRRQRINEFLGPLRTFGMVEQVQAAQGTEAAIWKRIASTFPAGADFLPHAEELS